jgi:mRNA-degrading endonuclease HigB of HigAB toxin-antitoxin module
VSHGSTTSRRPPALAFLLMAAFDFRRQLVLNVTHAEYDRVDALTL